ncbi:PREDICTED: uncharacterized protein LOC108767012 [Trachymyrmex cornetzi]|uniref:Uncharacterized protein n=1 Tax=Trachymyrmex cornetzi TaxID=471704 RepID=A0A195DK31_9HYME|nr:PREDICTED: uncharacterized protein LOC108767012 [Trachymyrmex cornetzi]KYN12844.1 hypothetical protein ALC57_14909 [Trachymyrmex cornetzi]
MYRRTTLTLLCLSITLSNSELFDTEKFRFYAKFLKFNTLNVNETGNELWHGLFRDCKKKVTFSCIQKNAYTYLDNAFIERDNITIFDGLILTKNNITYNTCPKRENRDDVHENIVDIDMDDCKNKAGEAKIEGRKFGDESPLEEITNALRRKTVKFLSTRNYEIQLPQFFFEGATMKISPREIDENGALLRVDFGTESVQEQGRIFKKIKKFIQNKLLTSFLALLLIIKLIKVKFLFIIPFLFGVGTAKKLFLKLLLFFIPAFAHIFKLCSSYYSNQATKFHHHHHQIAHHHHHVPVPVPVPTYYDHSHETSDGFTDYAHPHIQYRKDLEELKEWGIEPQNEPYGESSQTITRVVPAPTSVSGVTYSGPYGLAQYAPNIKPIASSYLDNSMAASAHNLVYSGYRRPVAQPNSATILSVNPGFVSGAKTPMKNSYAIFAPNIRPIHPNQAQRFLTPTASSPVPISRKDIEDEYYGPIIDRLENIFGQLRFYEETCREMLVCSMYKNPAGYSPHSNLVSNELSRDPQELRRDVTGSTSSQKFYRYMNAARYGQNGGDCLKTYPCHSNIE